PRHRSERERAFADPTTLQTWVTLGFAAARPPAETSVGSKHLGRRHPVAQGALEAKLLGRCIASKRGAKLAAVAGQARCARMSFNTWRSESGSVGGGW